MTEPATDLSPADPVRLVLFGPGGAGKSSLLGALAPPAPAADGRAADPLAVLREHVYHGGPAPAEAETVSYPVAVPEWGGAAAEAVVLDTAGRAAEELLRRPEGLDAP